MLACAALWLYLQRVTPVELAAYVPESAIGYVEINNLPVTLDRLTSTEAWSQLAPIYGIDPKINYLGKLGRLVRATGVGRVEWVALSRAQTALVVTSLEVRGEAVHPRMALLAETHLSPARLRGVIAGRLPELAGQLFGEAAAENSEYAGVAVRVYRAAEGDRRLFSAQIEGEWILANHAEAMEACLDARLGRAPNLAGNFYLQQARPLLGGEVFGFISSRGTTRLAQFGAHLIGQRIFGTSPLVEALQSVAGNLSTQASQGLAVGQTIESGGVVDRSLWFLQPQMVDQLRAAVKVKSAESRLLTETPAGVRGVTILRADEPSRSFDAVEAVISARLGVAESFLFQKFLFGVREALLGLRVGESAGGAFGDELASLSFGAESDERIWLVEAGDRARLEALAVRFLTERGAQLRRELRDGIEILVSGDERRGAAAFVGSAMAIGARAGILRLIEARKRDGAFVETEAFRSAGAPAESAPLISYALVSEESGRLMMAMARRLGQSGASSERGAALDRLPLAVSTWRLGERGVQGESRAPFGVLPWIVEMFEGETEVEGR